MNSFRGKCIFNRCDCQRYDSARNAGCDYCGHSYYDHAERKVMSTQMTCLYPGCNKPCAANPKTNGFYNYCSQDHANLAAPNRHGFDQNRNNWNNNSPSVVNTAPLATWKCSLQGCNVKFSKGSPHEPFCSEAHRSQYLQAYNTKPSLYPNLSNPTPSYNPQYIAQQTQQQQQQQTVYYQQPSATHPTHTYVNAFPNTVSSHSVGYNPQPPSYNQVVQTQVVQTQMAPSMPADTIWFYNRGEPYYEFTNFAETPVVIDGKEWPTTEHYFQAQKFVSDKSVMEHIRRLPTPRHCFEESRRLESKKRKDWEQVKDGIMEKAVFEKFTQHKKLKEMLLQTGTKTLVERSPYDKYWGDGADGTGQNKLGLILMKVRQMIRDKRL